jgi:glycosyltransferase involved in cell wall biosynthesis
VSDANLRQIRVLHLVSAGGVASALQPSLFMPLLTRLPRQRVKAQVACLSPGAVPSAVLRQNGVPTFDLALSRKRFSPKAFGELVQSTRNFRPDVIQAWGHTAQVISALLRKRCDWKPRLVWSASDTTPLAKNAGFIDRQKLKYAAKFSTRADRIVYASESGASQHRRVGFPDGGHETIPPGVDATRFKPDFAARRKLREELSLPGEAFVIGMAAPFQTEYDHATLIRAVGELIKTNPHIALVLAGHGVQKGNAPLMALVGGGSLSTRVHLLGEWSDINALYNACDVVCSSAVNDQSRMNIVMAMLCGVPVVATGIGAQGELIGAHGVAIEPGSPAAFIKGITRVMQLTPEKRTHMAQGARKHVLNNYVYVRSLQKYLQLYYDLIGRQSLVTKDLPAPEIDASLTVPPALPTEAELNAARRKPVTVVDLADPESLESKVSERELEELPKWRLEQEQERAKREAEVEAKVAESKSVGDVLEVFESQQVKALSTESPMNERARGVADDSEELLPQEILEVDAPAPSPRVSNAPSGAKKSSAPSPTQAAPQPDAAKQAALKAARMAALQPIAPAAKPAAKAASPVTRPPVTSPVTRPPATVAEKTDIARTQPLETLPEGTQAGLAALKLPEIADVSAATASRKVDLGSTQPLGTLAQELADAALLGAELADVSKPASKLEASKPAVSKPVASKAVESQPVESKLVQSKPVEPKPDDSTIATGSLNEFGELTLLATGEWQAMQRSDTKPETKSEAKAAKPAELSGAEALSLISKPAADGLALMPEPLVEPKRAANGE